MSRLSSILLLAVAATGVATVGAVFGQESQPTTTAPAIEEPASDTLAARTAGMTIEELVTEAYAEIKTAEARGDDAQEALGRAMQLINAIRAREPLNADAEFLSGRSNLLLGRPREAIGYISKYIATGKGESDWEAFNMLGDLYYRAKYYTMARDKYQKAIDLNPREADCYAGLAQAEMALTRPQKAAEYARKAVELDSPLDPAERNPKYHAALAEALLRQREVDEASKAATTAVEIARESARNDPTDPSLLIELDGYKRLLEEIIATTLINYPERTEEYARLVRVQKERAEITYLLSMHRVLAAAEQGIERSDPETPADLIVEQALLLVAVGRGNDAVDVLEELLSKDPENAEAQRLLGQIKPVDATATAAPITP